MRSPSFREHFRAIAGRYQSVRSLDQRARHYSTFRFYEPAESERALTTFRERLRATYDYPWAIPVRNSHLIAVARRRA
ncbi:MAG: hypothetical protein DMD49_02365 [Gemmatimonadetes bacterium]|nr:MAG: hypothetical protein DMD28_07305 [Gemmatimonadota bacterium]PYP33778.1 MAG: hypothetical protein DMD49_02365 [Gemmatimonadota bacterium]